MLKSTYETGEIVEQTRPAHLEFLKAEVEAGRLLLAGRQEDGSGGMLITTDMTAQEAQGIVDRDPYTRAGAARYQLSAFNGAYRARGL